MLLIWNTLGVKLFHEEASSHNKTSNAQIERTGQTVSSELDRQSTLEFLHLPPRSLLV
jgi:hypothetical protein